VPAPTVSVGSQILGRRLRETAKELGCQCDVVPLVSPVKVSKKRRGDDSHSTAWTTVRVNQASKFSGANVHWPARETAPAKETIAGSMKPLNKLRS